MNESLKSYLAWAYLMGSIWGVGFAILMTPVFYLFFIISAHFVEGVSNLSILALWEKIAAVSIPAGMAWGLVVALDARPRFFQIATSKKSELNKLIQSTISEKYSLTFESDELMVFKPSKTFGLITNEIVVITDPSGTKVRVPKKHAKKLKEGLIGT